MKNPVERAIDNHLEVIQSLHALTHTIESIGGRLSSALKQGKKILFAGNGGSAADAQHLAAEIVGRFERERSGLAALALTTDSSTLTSISNDYGFESVFSRQIEALGQQGDVLVAISTSGNSPNIIKATQAARERGIATIGLLGKTGGVLKASVDHALVVPSDNTARIQEAHILIGHILCQLIEDSPPSIGDIHITQ